MTLFALAVAPCSASPPRVVVYLSQCPSCPQPFGYDYPAQYVKELRAELYRMGIADVEVRYLSSTPANELDPLYEELGIPEYMRGPQAVVSVDDRFLFIDFVPAEIIAEFLSKALEEHGRTVVYRDLSRNMYTILGEDGSVRQCRILRSIDECTADQGLFSSPSGSMLLFVVTSGLLDGLNPCAFSILLFFIAVLFASSEVSIEKTRRGVMVVGSAYVVGLYVAYLAIGLGLMSVLSVLPFSDLFGKAAVLFVILVGAAIIESSLSRHHEFGLGIADPKLEEVKKWIDKFTIPSALVAGSMAGIFEFPCTGGIYLAVLGMLARNTTALQGLAYLLVYNLALVLPLIVLCVLASLKFHHKEIVEFLSPKCPLPIKKQLRLVSGLAMVAMGVFLLISGLV